MSTRTALALAERRLDAEQREFNAGLSSSFLVFHAQRAKVGSLTRPAANDIVGARGHPHS
jgi:hypothetical protein